MIFKIVLHVMSITWLDSEFGIMRMQENKNNNPIIDELHQV